MPVRFRFPLLLCSTVVLCSPGELDAQEKPVFLSHAPVRELPKAIKGPPYNGGTRFVDPARGDDAAAGTEAVPFRTINKALQVIQPGETIVLRGGTYNEQVVIKNRGKAGSPIILKSYPEELVTIDAGYPEFFNNPADAWEPFADGAPREYRSTKTYPEAGRVAGNFGDSLLPLNPYRFVADLRAENEVPLPNEQKTDDHKRKYPPCYFGPGVWWDEATGRIHIRLAHTHLPALDSNYTGETDPRKIPLVIAPWKNTPLTFQDAAHVYMQDLVLRGGGDNTLLMRGCEDIRLHGFTLYVANRGLRVETTGPLEVLDGKFRGTMPPWGSRGVSKYRTTDSHLFVPVGTQEIERDKRKYFEPQCHDFTIVGCEFTDSHDGVYLGGVQRLTFFQNLVDNMNDDGVYLSAWGPPGSDVRIHHNTISRCLTAFAFGLGRNQESDPGESVCIYRNVIDLRKPVLYQHPKPEDKELTFYGRLCGDHASPIWEPIKFYHNTVLTHAGDSRGAYAAGWGSSLRGTTRAVFNNLFVQETGLPGLEIQSAEADEFQAAGNLHWSYDAAAMQGADLPARLKILAEQIDPQTKSVAGWGKHDLLADPLFVRRKPGDNLPQDLRLSAKSPAVNAGVPLPAEWPDPQRPVDQGPPDVGAEPLGRDAAAAAKAE